jgi:hypothetical protein
MMGGKTPATCWAVNKCQKISWKMVASGWWNIWIVRWCMDLQTLNFYLSCEYSLTHRSFVYGKNLLCCVWLIYKILGKCDFYFT